MLEKTKSRLINKVAMPWEHSLGMDLALDFKNHFMFQHCMVKFQGREEIREELRLEFLPPVDQQPSCYLFLRIMETGPETNPYLVASVDDSCASQLSLCSDT